MKTGTLSTMLAALVLTAATSAHAARLDGQTQENPIEIAVLEDGNWGYSEKATHPGDRQTQTVRLVPVTREAFETLESLDRSGRYACILEKTTTIRVHATQSAHFVVEINCD